MGGLPAESPNNKIGAKVTVILAKLTLQKECSLPPKCTLSNEIGMFQTMIFSSSILITLRPKTTVWPLHVLRQSTLSLSVYAKSLAHALHALAHLYGCMVLSRVPRFDPLCKWKQRGTAALPWIAAAHASLASVLATLLVVSQS
jgi:hypothetical protein